MSALAECLRAPQAVTAVAAALTLILFAESRWLPWSPFFLIFAVLAPALPLATGAYAFGDPVAPWRDHGGFIAALGLAMLVWEHGVAYWLYERVLLRARGRDGSVFHSPTAALAEAARAAREKARMGGKTFGAVQGCYTLLWAPLAEELFYWGYLYGGLRAAMPAGMAGLITSLFFAARHLAHFMPLREGFPLAAAAAVFVNTGVTAGLNGMLFEGAHSLYPLMALHFVSNLLFLFHRPPPAQSAAEGRAL
jgi:membrane protease YdiL (CAAX protease family)